MRGTESHHVLVLVDGVRIGSATLGTAAFQHLQPALDRAYRDRTRAALQPVGIRGAGWRDSPVFTRRSSGEKPRFSLDARGGSYDTFEVTGGVSGRVPGFRLQRGRVLV